MPAWMLKFGTLQISLSPNRSSADVGSSSAPPIQNHSSRNVETPPRRTQPPHHTPRERTPAVRSTTPIFQTPGSSAVRSATPIFQTPDSPAARSTSPIFGTPQRDQDPVPRPGHRYPRHRPRPIYPLRPGDEAPPLRTFDPSRTHGYYVVFVGPRLGIFHEYW